MELILGIGLLTLFGRKIFKVVTNSVVFLFIIATSLFLTFAYDISFIISLSICIIIKYGILDFIKDTKNSSKTLIISKNRFKYGHVQKLVSVLINWNFTLFVLLCYGFSINELINFEFCDNSLEAISFSIVIIVTVKICRKILEMMMLKMHY